MIPHRYQQIVDRMGMSSGNPGITRVIDRNVRRRPNPSLFQQVMRGVVNQAASVTGVPSGVANAVFDTAMDAANVGAQQAILNAAKRTVDQMTGAGEQDIDRDNINMPAAAIIPGRGAEVGIVSKGFQGGSKLKLPGGNAKLHNAFAEQIKAWQPVTAKMSFAYKGILAVTLGNSTEPATRFYTHQFFRHVALGINSANYADNTLAWNNTLGPDSSYIRKTPASGGSLQGTVPAGANTGLKSAYRYPTTGSSQIIRLGRNLLENIGWNANPYKHVTAATTAFSTPTVTTLPTTQPLVYADAGVYFVDDPSNAARSLPSMQPTQMATPASPLLSTSCYYRSQFGTGLINYQFCNDGTTPIVVDIVVTKLKKGEQLPTTGLYVSELEAAFKKGYLNMCLGNRGVVDFEGSQVRDMDIFDNSKVEFMPKKALTYYPQNSGLNAEPRPFVFVARDQFIVDAGCVKPYEMKLPAINYYAPDYLQTQNHVDDLSYCVSVAFSTLSVPLIEPLTTGSAIIDRRGNSLNMSVTGTYTERCHPVYLSEYNNNFYVNGALNVPKYIDGTVPTLARSSIIPPEMSTRSSAASTAFIEIGASNTQSGA